MSDTILILGALLCFGLETFGVTARISLGWLGVFLLTLTLVI